MLNKAIKTIEKYNMIQKGDFIVAGLSGGADSVALLKILCDIRPIYDIDICAVHVHHGIRGKEADDDRDFSVDICRRFGVDIIVKEYDIPLLSKEMGLGSEETGRLMRYKAFNEVLEQHGKGKIAVAHNENDNAETVIMRLCRGTGIKGLCGIPPVRGNIIRPLIHTSRKEIEEFLKEENISFITDSTNLTDDYTRNKIRHNILPVLEENINSNTISNIASASQMISEEESLLEYVTKEYFEKCLVKAEKNEIIFNAKTFSSLHEALKGRIIRLAINKIAKSVKDITKTHIESVKDIFEGNTGRKISLPYKIEAVKEYKNCIIRKQEEEVKDFHYEINDEKTYIKECGIYIWLSHEKDKYAEKYKCFNAERTGDKFWVRNRQPSDKIDINKDGRTKKLKDIFIDKKVPKNIRDKVPVIGCENGILWVFDYRGSVLNSAFENDENKIYINIRRKEK